MGFTDQQIEAINKQGRVIVSASAGSGKTRVMIERLVRLILEEAGDIRSVLAVTFTNKAAAQMREKLRGALLERLRAAEGREKEHLKEQLHALPLADISTIHAFCARLIRSNFYLADVDPAFRVISPDDPDGKSLSGRAMDEVFEELYEESSAELLDLLAVYFRRKKDDKLREIIGEIYGAVRGEKDYRGTLLSAGADDFDGVCAYLAGDIGARAQFYFDCAEEEFDFFADENARAQNVCKGIMLAAKLLTDERDLFKMAAKSEEFLTIPNCPPATRATGELLKHLKKLSALSAGIKDLFKELKKYEPRDVEYARYLDGQKRAAALAVLTLKYDEAYTRLKRETGVLDYDDLEHIAFEILQNPDALAAVRDKYKFVFVDEYQDVNPMQEAILTQISGENVFLVGDMKQSIYGFRGSRSAYFAKKTQEFEHSLLLTKNFRSGMGVLDAVNAVFSTAMTKATADIDYASALMLGSERCLGHDGETVYHYIPKEKKEKEPPTGVYSVLEASGRTEVNAQAERIAQAIAEEYGSDFFDADAGVVKKADWGDIAVLVRKNTGDMEKVVAALASRGIPVTTAAKVNVFDSWEARLVLDWLSYLDNAEQDIPLAGAMLSSVGGFTEDELTKVRLRFPSASTFRAACTSYAQKMDDELSAKLKTFFALAENLRLHAGVSTAKDTLLKLLSMGLETEIAARENGARRLMRVRKIVAEAEGSVHAFLSRLARSDYKLDFSEGGGENAVKVLTMHASKGLEYPIVMLAGLDAPFHGAEHGEVVYTEKFRLAPRSFDVEKKLVYDTALRRASAVYEEGEELKQEFNLLYVAMTRAMYRLHLFFGDCPRAVSPRFANRFSDFFDFAEVSRKFKEETLAEQSPLSRHALEAHGDGELRLKILSVLGHGYAHDGSTLLPVKSSATELMRKSYAPTVYEATGNRKNAEEPAMYGVRNAEGAPTADTGTAYHIFLEHVDFTKNAGEEFDRMIKENLLTPEQTALIDREKLDAVLRIPCLAGVAGKTLRREQQFLVSLPASEVFGTAAEDEIVFQGAIDLLAEGKDGTTIIDYKFSSHDDGRIRRDYAPQIALYKKAVARILRIDERMIRAVIVNILQCREIPMD